MEAPKKGEEISISVTMNADISHMAIGFPGSNASGTAQSLLTFMCICNSVCRCLVSVKTLPTGSRLPPQIARFWHNVISLIPATCVIWHADVDRMSRRWPLGSRLHLADCFWHALLFLVLTVCGAWCADGNPVRRLRLADCFWRTGLFLVLTVCLTWCADGDQVCRHWPPGS